MINTKEKLSREKMVHTIIFMLDDGGIRTKDIVEKTGMSSVIHIRKRYSLLLNISYEDVIKLYEVALELVGYKPSKEEMIEEVQNLFKRNISDYEILQKTGVASVSRFKNNKEERFRYDTLYKLYKFEFSLKD
ncbi:hypothetical protein HU219_12425 [Staphylococcus sp. SS35]|nr:hypothetical protein [Staphylococcus singaporensis]